MEAPPRRLRRFSSLGFALLILSSPLAAQDNPDREYELTCEATLRPHLGAVDVQLTLGRGARWVTRFTLSPRIGRYQDFSADGDLQVSDQVVWTPPERGGTLTYRMRIEQVQDPRRGTLSARCTPEWALFKLDHLIPGAGVRNYQGARSLTTLRLYLPAGWRVALPGELAEDGSLVIRDPDTWLDRPRGWILCGRLEHQVQLIGSTRLEVAWPAGEEVPSQHYLDTFAACHAAAADLFGQLPPRLLLVCAGDPMWLGGLSGRDSIYLHSQRLRWDLDGTHPFLHELFHVATRAVALSDGDWVAEGLAELYSLKLAQRGGLIDADQLTERLELQAQRGERVTNVLVPESSGAVTARAVVALEAIDQALRAETDGARSLDDVVRLMVATRPRLTSDGFKQLVDDVLGRDSDALFQRHVPGWSQR